MHSRLVLTLLLAAATVGCSLAFKGGAHSFSNGAFEDLRDKPAISVINLEVGIREFADGRVDLAGGLGFVEAPDRTDFNDIYLVSRYRFRKDERVAPFAGAGVGFYQWKTQDPVVIPEPFCFPLLSVTSCQSSRNRTLSDGIFPHVSVGLEIRATPGVRFVIEDRFDFAKDDASVEFDSNQITAGVKFRLRY